MSSIRSRLSFSVLLISTTYQYYCSTQYNAIQQLRFVASVALAIYTERRFWSLSVLGISLTLELLGL
jgi:hypothetical protein